MSDQLKDIIERLDRAAKITEASTVALAVSLAEARLLDEEDRVQVSRLIRLVQRLLEQGEVTLGGTQRLERTAAFVAEDLKASIVRADQAPTDVAGAGADAALRSPGPGETASEVAAHDEAQNQL